MNFRECFNKLSLENGMDLGIVPNKLSNLTMIEEQLIAWVHPLVYVFKLHGGQLGYSGQVINFPQDIHTVLKVLPIHIDDLTNLLISDGSHHADFMVNRNRVYNALCWLKHHNIYYKGYWNKFWQFELYTRKWKYIRYFINANRQRYDVWRWKWYHHQCH